MEKTIQITIGATVFSLTEAAYSKLSAYLDGLKAHFASVAEGAEIMRDIESRIAEKLLPKREHVVTESDIAAVVAEIGDASAFDDEDTEPVRPAAPQSRKLYRDMDNAWLGGVAAGLAAYFDIDPIWTRLIFLASIFFGGTGIVLYIILWILVPEAKSTGQKLEMRGAPVDIEGITRVVKESVDNVRESGAVQNFARAIHRFIAGFFRILGRIFGVFLTFGSFIAIIALTIGAGIIATNWNAPYNDFPLRDVVSTPLLVTGFIGAYIAMLIPLIAILALGVRLIIKKTIVPSAVAFGLIGIWALAFCTVATIGITASGKYFAYTQTSPDHQTVSQTLELDAFSSVSASRGRITIREGAEQSVVLEGRAMDMQRVSAEVVDGVLTIRKIDEPERLCIFCDERSPDVIITTPDLDAMRLESSSVSFDEYTDEALSLDARSTSMRGTLAIAQLDVRMESSSLRADVEADELSIEAESSHFNLDGSARTATLSLQSSHFDGYSFRIGNAAGEVESSFVSLYVTGEMGVASDRSSNVRNRSELVTE